MGAVRLALVAAARVVLGVTVAPLTACQEQPPAIRTFSHGLDIEPSRDPLLARARASLASGRVDPTLMAAVVASDDPAHARARRILQAMQDEEATAEPATATQEDDGGVVGLVPTPLSVVREALDKGSPTSTPKPKPTPTATPKPTSDGIGKARTAAARPKIRSLALRPSGKGATLTLRATSGVLVGVVNQRRSGLVRLVVDASAEPDTLRARPRVRGAAVTAVRRVGQSVFVTLQLDPGWALGRITKTGAGARVELHPV